MKVFGIAALIMMFSFGLMAQYPLPTTDVQGNSALQGTYDISNRVSDFYNQNGMMRVQAGNSYMGTSLAYMMTGSGKFMYGLNVDMVWSNSGVNRLDNGVFYQTFDQTALLVPAWLSFKYRFGSVYNQEITPYAIGGAGPTFGFAFDRGDDFFNSLSNANAYIGGGAFVGLGVDYLWAEEWAISADVRYNVIRFDAPVGSNSNFDGVSFFFGFIHAFGY